MSDPRCESRAQSGFAAIVAINGLCLALPDDLLPDLDLMVSDILCVWQPGYMDGPRKALATFQHRVWSPSLDPIEQCRIRAVSRLSALARRAPSHATSFILDLSVTYKASIPGPIAAWEMCDQISAYCAEKAKP
jgi:hypothetical protein